MAVKIKSNFLNPFEKLYYDSVNNPLFSKDKWEDLLSNRSQSELEQYSELIKQANDKGLTDTYVNDWYWNDMSLERQLIKMRSDLGYANNVDVNSYDIVTGFDEQGKEIVEKKDFTEKQYYDYLLDSWKNELDEELKIRQLEQIKQDKSVIGKVAATVGSTVGRVGIGTLKAVEDTLNVFEALLNAGGELVNDLSLRDALDRFRYEMGDDSILGGMPMVTDDLLKSLEEFDAKNSYYVKADGSATGFGRIVGSAAVSVGQMLPSIFLSASGVSSAISQGSFYASMWSGQMHEAVNEYPSVSTEMLILNTSAKVAAEYAIEKGLAKVLGTTKSDELRGLLGSTKKVDGVVRLAADTLQEGLEEGLQEFSNVLVDKAFSLIEEDFRTDIDIQQIFDASVSGMIASLITGGFAEVGAQFKKHSFANKLAKNALSSDETYENLSGKDKRKYASATKKVQKSLYDSNTMTSNKFVKLTDDYGFGTVSIKNVYSKISGELSAYGEQASKTLAKINKQALVGYKTLSDYYSTIGPERAAKAEQLLNDINSKNVTADEYLSKSAFFAKQMTANFADTPTRSILKSVLNAARKRGEEPEDLEKYEVIDDVTEELNELLTKTDEEIEALGEEDKKIVKTARELAKLYEQDLVIWDNHQIVEKDGKIFAPLAAVENLPALEIMKSAAEHTIASSYEKAIPDKVLNEIVKLFKEFANGVQLNRPKNMRTRLYTVYNLLYNKQFYNYVLYRGNVDVFNVLKTVDNTLVTLAKNRKDDVKLVQQYYNAVKRIRQNIGPALALYFCNNTSADLDKVTMFTDAQLAYIREHRQKIYSAQTLVEFDAKDPNYNNYKNVVFNQINALPVDNDTKLRLTSAFENEIDKNNDYAFAAKQVRRNALDEINSIYNKILYDYNGTNSRIQSTDSNSAVFNSFLTSANMTVEQLLGMSKEDLNKVKSDFKLYTNNSMSFEVVDGGEFMTETVRSMTDDEKRKHIDNFMYDRKSIKITNDVVTNVDGSYFTAYINEQMFQNQVYVDTEVVYASIDDYLKPILKIDEVEFTYTTVEDILNSPKDYLKDEITDSIYAKTRRLNRATVLDYLRKVLIDKSGGQVDLVMNNSGKIIPAFMCDVKDFFTEEIYASVKDGLKYDRVEKYNDIFAGQSDDLYILKQTIYDEKGNVKHIVGELFDKKEYDKFNLSTAYLKKYVKDKYDSLIKKLGITDGAILPIDKFIKKNKIPKGLSNLTVTFYRAANEVGGYFDADENTIYFNLDRQTLTNLTVLNTVIHEYQHAYQSYANLAQGMSRGIDVSDEMIKDFSAHVPFINASKNKKNAVRDYVYFSAFGEQMSRGTYQEYTSVYPIFVEEKYGQVTITTPWGTKHKITMSNSNFDKPVQALIKDFYERGYTFDTLSDLNPAIKEYERSEQTRDEWWESMELKNKLYDHEFYNEVREWNGKAISRTADAKESVLTKPPLDYRNMSLELLWRWSGLNDVTYDDFLEMDLPFVRVQNTPAIADDTFVSIVSDASKRYVNSLMQILTKDNLSMEFSASGDIYLFTGTFKPKDLYLYIDNGIKEGLIKPTALSNINVYKIKPFSPYLDANMIEEGDDGFRDTVTGEFLDNSSFNPVLLTSKKGVDTYVFPAEYRDKIISLNSMYNFNIEHAKKMSNIIINDFKYDNKKFADARGFVDNVNSINLRDTFIGLITASGEATYAQASRDAASGIKKVYSSVQRLYSDRNIYITVKDKTNYVVIPKTITLEQVNELDRVFTRITDVKNKFLANTVFVLQSGVRSFEIGDRNAYTVSRQDFHSYIVENVKVVDMDKSIKYKRLGIFPESQQNEQDGEIVRTALDENLKTFNTTEEALEYSEQYVDNINEAFKIISDKKKSNKKVYKSNFRHLKLSDDVVAKLVDGSYRKGLDETYQDAKKRIREIKRQNAKKDVKVSRKEFVKQQKASDRSRQLFRKNAVGTNLMYWVNKYKDTVPEPSSAVQEFVIAADDLSQIPDVLAKEIKNATLTERDIYNFIRDTDEINDYTWNALKNSFFRKTKFTSFEQLKKFTASDVAVMAYGLKAAFNDVGKNDEVEKYRDWSPDKFVEFAKKWVNRFDKNSDEYKKLNEKQRAIIDNMSEAYHKTVKEFYGSQKVETSDEKKIKHSDKNVESEEGEELVVKGHERDKGSLEQASADILLGSLQYFDGTLDSIAYVGGNAINQLRKEVYSGNARLYKSKKDVLSRKETKGKSLNETVGGKKGDDSEMDLLEVIADAKQRFSMSSEEEEADAKGLIRDSIREYFARKIKQIEKTGKASFSVVNKVLRDNNLPVVKGSNKPELYASILPAMNGLVDLTRNWTFEEALDRVALLESRDVTGISVLQALGFVQNEVVDAYMNRSIEENEATELVENLSNEKLTAEEKVYRSGALKRVHGRLSTIRKKLNSKIYNNIPDEYKQFFDAKRSFYAPKNVVNKLTVEELDALYDELGKLNDELNAGKYIKKVTKRELKLEREIAELKAKYKKLEESKAKNPVYKYDIGTSDTLTFDREMPKKLSELMNTTLTRTRASTIQIDSVKGERQFVIRSKKFYEYNAETLSTMTYDDAVEIVDFFENAPTSNDIYGPYSSFQLFTLAYIIEQIEKYGTWNDTEYLLERCTKRASQIVRQSASILGSWDAVKKRINPTKAIAQEIALTLGITLTDEELDPLMNVFKNLRKRYPSANSEIEKLKAEGKWLKLTKEQREKKLADAKNFTHAIDNAEYFKEVTDSLNQVMSNLERTIVAKHQKQIVDGSKKLGKTDISIPDKRVLYDRILKFQKAMMLSSPATWLRNGLSNVVLGGINIKGHHIGGLNDAADIIGNLFRPKKGKEYKPGEGEKAQYNLTGIKVTHETMSFIQKWMLDSGLLNLLTDGLSKYDPRSVSSSTDISEQLTASIVEALKTRVLGLNTFGKGWLSKKLDARRVAKGKDVMERGALDTVVNWIFERSADSKAIQDKAIQYIGKMLQADNINLSNGLSNEVMEIIVEGYTFAAYEFMHRSNFISKIESNWRKNHPDSFFIGKLTLPFLSSSWNWFLEALQMNPVSLIANVHKLNKLEKIVSDLDERRHKQYDKSAPSSRFAEMIIRRNIGKGVIGSVLMMFGAALAAFGVFKVDEEDEKIKLNIKDTWIDISNVFGSSSLLVGAAIVTPFKDNNKIASLGTVFDSAFNQQFDDSLLTTFINMFRYDDTPSEFVKSIVPNVAAGFIPNLWKSVVRITRNYEVKYSAGLKGSIEYYLLQLLPWYDAWGMERKIDPYTGEEQTIYSMPYLHQLINAVSPLSFKTYHESDVELEFRYYNLRKQALKGEYDDTGKLDYEKLNKFYGKLNNQRVKEFMNDKVAYKVENEKGTYDNLYYSQMSDKQKKSVLDRITTQNALYAKIYVWTNEGHKYYCSSEKRAELVKLGITKNVYIGDKGFVR